MKLLVIKNACILLLIASGSKKNSAKIQIGEVYNNIIDALIR